MRQPSQVMGLPTEKSMGCNNEADKTTAILDICYWRTGVQLRAL
jgi:hypothetical protein